MRLLQCGRRSNNFFGLLLSAQLRGQSDVGHMKRQVRSLTISALLEEILMPTIAVSEAKTMLTLPGDAVRQIQWRFADRFDLQMLVQSTRGVARGTVARLVAAGERNTHEWTPAKAEMLLAFDRAGVTAAFMEPEEGGFISGPKNLALSLSAFELAWVDGGAATASLASFLALSPIHERGTPHQVARYKTLAAPPQAGEDDKPWRGPFALTEPIPYVGVDTGMLSGRVTVSEWKDGEEPWLQVEKRGRFIDRKRTRLNSSH